jgi:outer membrane protein assembly factor BamB
VGVGGGRVVAGSSEGDLIAVDSDTGAKQWQVNIRGEVLTAPAVGESVVVVRTVDGRIHGLDAKDGHELWSNEQAVPRLSLRGNAPPAVVGDMVIAGFDNGKVLALTLQNGEVQWETAVAPAKGRTELERMIDIDAAVRVSDKDVYVVGFQGRVAMLALDSGQIWWAHDTSSHRGLVLGEENLYMSTSDGDVVALRRRDGSPVWEQKILHKRGLTAPTVDGDAIVVADFEGYVHWLDAATGEIMARQKTDGKRVSNAPLAADGKVYVMTDNGKLSAFKRGVKLAVSEAGRKAEAESAREAEEKRQKKVEKAMKANKPKAEKTNTTSEY